MRRVVAVTAMVLALGACAKDDRVLPPGEYAGSTKADQAIRISVADQPKVNGQKADWGEPGEIRAVSLPGKPTFKCVSAADGQELRCQLGDETIELMKE